MLPMELAGSYDHRNPSRFSEAECAEMVGREFTLPLTGRVVGTGSSRAGPYVRFEVDERWGLGPSLDLLGLDADALLRPTPREVSVDEIANWLRVMGWHQSGTMGDTGPGAARMAEMVLDFLAGRVAR